MSTAVSLIDSIVCSFLAAWRAASGVSNSIGIRRPSWCWRSLRWYAPSIQVRLPSQNSSRVAHHPLVRRFHSIVNRITNDSVGVNIFNGAEFPHALLTGFNPVVREFIADGPIPESWAIMVNVLNVVDGKGTDLLPLEERVFFSQF